MKEKKWLYNREGNTGLHHIQVTGSSLRLGVKMILSENEVHVSSSSRGIWYYLNLGLTTHRHWLLFPASPVRSLHSGHAHTGTAWAVVHVSLPQRFNGNFITRIWITHNEATDPQHSWARYAKPYVRVGPRRLSKGAPRGQGSWSRATFQHHHLFVVIG